MRQMSVDNFKNVVNCFFGGHDRGQGRGTHNDVTPMKKNLSPSRYLYPNKNVRTNRRNFRRIFEKKPNPKSFGGKKSFRSFDPEVENEETELSFQGGDQKLRKLVEISGKEEEEKKRGKEGSNPRFHDHETSRNNVICVPGVKLRVRVFN